MNIELTLEEIIFIKNLFGQITIKAAEKDSLKTVEMIQSILAKLI